jgi:hypothetical protein
MDFQGANVIFLDNRVQVERFETAATNDQGLLQSVTAGHSLEPQDLLDDVRSILGVFRGGKWISYLCRLLMVHSVLTLLVHVLNTGSSCLAKIRQLDSVGKDCNPTIVLIPLTLDSKSIHQSTSGSLLPKNTTSDLPFRQENHRGSVDEGEEINGVSLIQHIKLEASENHISKLIIPVALIHSNQGSEQTSSHAEHPKGFASTHIIRCLELGAKDVIKSPLQRTQLEGLSTHVYSAHIEGSKARPAFLEMRKSRKLSWVGVEEEKPYAYLREAMYDLILEMPKSSVD